MKSRSEASAHCMSSKTSTAGYVSDSRSKKSRHAAKSSLRSRASWSPSAMSCASRGSTNRRSSSSRMCSSSVARSFASAGSAPSSSPIRQRIRTMSASAQYVTPSP